MLNVGSTPIALRLSRAEAVGIAELVDAFFDTVNPTETQCFLHGLGISQPSFTGILFEEADPQFGHLIAIYVQPAAKLGRGFEMFDLHDEGLARSADSLSAGIFPSTKSFVESLTAAPGGRAPR